jgi:uncharacterized protein GlcG (DUF336 family)
MGADMQLVQSSSTISAEAGQSLISAAILAAERAEVPMSIAIVDPAGGLRHFHRMVGAALLGVQISMDKAYTAAALGLPTSAWFGMIGDDPVLLHGMVHTPRLMIVGGGVPLYLDGALVGAIGLSGGHYTQDEAVALDAVREVGFESAPPGP